MRLKEIQSLMEETEKKVKAIPMRIKAYPVLVIAYRTILFSEMDIQLFRYPELFIPYQPLAEKSQELFAEYKYLESQIKSAERGKKKIKYKKVNALKKKKNKIENQLIQNLSMVEFKTPQFELRFYDLDMDAIQAIKEHPVVRKVGKTNMSRASIRVVIG